MKQNYETTVKSIQNPKRNLIKSIANLYKKGKIINKYCQILRE